MMARAPHDKNDVVAGKTPVATIVTFDVVGCANPARWASTATEAWRCPCCGAWIAPGQTHQRPVRSQKTRIETN